VVEAPASLVDVVPTLLDLLGLPSMALAQGISLVPALRGEIPAADRPIYFSWLPGSGAGVRRGSWKYLQTSRGSSLYDLDEDPAERRSLRGRRRVRAKARALLAEHGKVSALLRAEFIRKPAAASSGPEVTQEIEDSLRALGYIE
jgi:arylsulfatase A-like enzyme